MITTILFDLGDTLVHEAEPGTPVDRLEVRPTPGAEAILAALAPHLRLGAVTDAAVMTGDDVRRLLAGRGLAAHLATIVSSVDIGVPKPDPTGVHRALAALGAEPGEAVLVGNAAVDRAAAAAAGVGFAPASPAVGVGPAVVAALAPDRGWLGAARLLVGPADEAARATAAARHDRLTKPPGSLGRLESLGTQLAAIAGAVPPPSPSPATVGVFAADHGVVAAGITPWPQEVTAQMVANFVGGGAAINVLARQVGAEVVVVDVGVATPLPPLAHRSPVLRSRAVRAGTDDLSRGPAMTVEDARRALDVGAEVAVEAVAGGARCLVTGEMGIGNTTASAAVIAALTGRPATEVTGHGSGIDDAGRARKVEVIARAGSRLRPDADVVEVLAEVGGLEIAALAGFIVAGAALRVPVVVDGVIADAALLAAAALEPDVVGCAVAGHRSCEPGATAALEHLGLEPLLDLDLRLGEGTGACLALPLLEAAAGVLAEMATLDDLGIAPG